MTETLDDFITGILFQLNGCYGDGYECLPMASVGIQLGPRRLFRRIASVNFLLTTIYEYLIYLHIRSRTHAMQKYMSRTLSFLIEF